MYNFIFYFYYKYFKKRNDFDPIFSAKVGLTSTIAFHIFFLLVIFKYFLDVSIPRFHESYAINKAYLIPVVILQLIIVLVIYNKKRTRRIIQQYELEEKIFSIKNILFIIFINVFPLLIGIYLLK